MLNCMSCKKLLSDFSSKKCAKILRVLEITFRFGTIVLYEKYSRTLYANGEIRMCHIKKFLTCLYSHRFASRNKNVKMKENDMVGLDEDM